MGLTVLWSAALGIEVCLLIDGAVRVRAARLELAQKRSAVDRMTGNDPSRAAEGAASIESDLATAQNVLASLQVEFAERCGATGQEASPSGSPKAPAIAVPEVGDLVRDLRERARRAGVSVRPQEEFGLGATGREPSSPTLSAANRHRSEAAVHMVGTLLAAHPAQLISVEWARAPGRASKTVSSEPLQGDGAAGELIDFVHCRSVQEPGLIETVPIRITFTGTTATLRQFLNQLFSGRELVAISQIAVESAATTGTAHHGESGGSELVEPTVQPSPSRFVVTAEFCKLVAQHTAERLMASPAVAVTGAEPLPRCWTSPSQQQRGRGWIYEIFAPPTLFCSRRGHAVAAVPAAEGVLTEKESAPLDLQLIRVRKKPFRMRLVGFVGNSGDLRGIFTDTTSGKTVIGREGDRLAGSGVSLKHLSLKPGDLGGTKSCEFVATATVLDEETGEEIVIDTRGPTPAGASLGMFSSRKNPAWRNEFKEGSSIELDGTRYRVERIEVDPPLAVVTVASADGLLSRSHVLTSNVSADLPSDAHAIAAVRPSSREPSKTP